MCAGFGLPYLIFSAVQYRGNFRSDHVVVSTSTYTFELHLMYLLRWLAYELQQNRALYDPVHVSGDIFCIRL
jgi:hypothetical protein